MFTDLAALLDADDYYLFSFPDEFRILASGSRNYKDYDTVYSVLRLITAGLSRRLSTSRFTLVHGHAPGLDTLAALAACQMGWSTDPFPADWDECGWDCPPTKHRKTAYGNEYCPLAGGRRNQKMCESHISLGVFFPLGKSFGTYDCLERAQAARISVLLVPELVSDRNGSKRRT